MVSVGCLNAVTTIQYKGMKAINAKIDRIIRETVFLENLLIFILFINSHPLQYSTLELSHLNCINARDTKMMNMIIDMAEAKPR